VNQRMVTLSIMQTFILQMIPY